MREGQKARVTGNTSYGHRLEVGTIVDVVEVGDGWVAVRGKSAKDGKVIRQTLDPWDLEPLGEKINKVRIVDNTRYGHNLKIGTIGQVVKVRDSERWLVLGESNNGGEVIRQTLHPCDLEVLDETINKVRIVDCTRYGHALKIGSLGQVVKVQDSERWLVLGESNYGEDVITQTVHPCDLEVLDETQPAFKEVIDNLIDNLIETFKASDYTELEIIAYLEGYKAGCEASERK